MNKLFWHQLAVFGVLGSLTLMRFLTGNAGLNLSLFWWWLGGIMGFLFVFIDRFVYAFMSYPEETLSLRLRELFGREKIVNSLALALAERDGQDKPVIRSALFLVVWAVLTVLTVTSIANTFSRGFILGLSTHLIFDLGWDYWANQGRNIGSWFWQVRNVTRTERNVFVWAAFVFYSAMVWFL